MDTKELSCFIRCCEEKSINKAAKQLFITPQGLSKIIRNLEDEFHTRLFDRTPQGITPTESGEYLYRQSRGLFIKLEEIKTGMERLQERGRKIRIGFSCGVLQVLPFAGIEQCKKEHPERTILWEESSNDEIKARLQRGELDLAFVVGHFPTAGIYAQEIFSTKLYAVVYEGHRLFSRKKLRIADLKDEPLITLNEKYQCYYSLANRFHDLGFSPNIVIKTVESSLIYRLCEAETGIGIDVNIHDPKELVPHLRYIEIEDTLPWNIYVTCRSEDSAAPWIREILQYMRENRRGMEAQ